MITIVLVLFLCETGVNKKYVTIRVFDRGFSQDPYRPLGDFEIPLRAPRIGAKIPCQKPECSI